jgi:hypothetical protein
MREGLRRGDCRKPKQSEGARAGKAREKVIGHVTNSLNLVCCSHNAPAPQRVHEIDGMPLPRHLSSAGEAVSPGKNWVNEELNDMIARPRD